MADSHDRLGTAGFADKPVIVTGAGNGTGLRHAEAFAAEGAMVTIADIDGDASTPGTTPGRRQ